MKQETSAPNMKTTHSRQVATLVGCLMFALAGCSQPAANSPETATASPAPQRVTSESVVRVNAEPVDISAGGSAEANITLTIQSGYHVNANPPTFPYLKATALDVSAADGISLGSITYPKALEKKFPFAEKPLAVYEGTTIVKALLKADPAAKPGQRSLSAQVRIQACDDQVCYAPGTLSLALPVNIK